MKKLVKCVLVILLLLAVGVGTFFLVRHFTGGFTDKDITDAYEKGKADNEKFIKELEQLILSLEKQLDDIENEVYLSELEEMYSDIIAGIEEDLENSSSSLVSVIESKKGMLIAVKAEIIQAVAQCERQTETLNTQLSEVEETIKELKNKEGNWDKEIAEFEELAEKIGKEITELERACNSFADNIAEIDGLLDLLNDVEVDSNAFIS